MRRAGLTGTRPRRAATLVPRRRPVGDKKARAPERTGLMLQNLRVMHVADGHVRIAAGDGEGERVVLDVGPENDALGEGVDGSRRRSRALQLAGRQVTLADVTDVNAAAFRGAAAADRRAIRVVQIFSQVVGNKAVDLVERDGRIGAAGRELLRNILRQVDSRGIAQIADNRRDTRIDADVNTNAVGVVVDVVVEIAVEVAVGVEVAVAVQITVAVAVQIAVQIGGNLRLGLTLALEAQLALAFALALTLILVLIVRIPPIAGHYVSPSDTKACPSLRRITDLLRLRPTTDLRHPFTSIKIELHFHCSQHRLQTNDPQRRKAIRPNADP